MSRVILKSCIVIFCASFAGCGVRAVNARAVTFETVQEMRESAIRAEGILTVSPLTDSQVPALISAAHDAQKRGDLPRSRTLLERARALAPNNPLVEQEFAELQLMEGQLEDARKAAIRSYESGPGVGPLCQRNWLTVAWVHDIHGEEDASADAMNGADRCVLREKPRL